METTRVNFDQAAAETASSPEPAINACRYVPLEGRGRPMNLEIRRRAAELRATGMKMETIAKRMGISAARVGQLLRPLTEAQVRRAR